MTGGDDGAAVALYWITTLEIVGFILALLAFLWIEFNPKSRQIKREWKAACAKHDAWLAQNKKERRERP